MYLPKINIQKLIILMKIPIKEEIYLVKDKNIHLNLKIIIKA